MNKNISLKLFPLFLILISYSIQAAKLFSNEEIYNMMSEVADNYSKNLPQRLDQATILEGVFAGGRRDIVFKYKLILDRTDPLYLEELKNLISRKHKNNFCTQPTLAIYRNQKITMEHNFMDQYGSFLFSIRLDNSVCY